MQEKIDNQNFIHPLEDLKKYGPFSSYMADERRKIIECWLSLKAKNFFGKVGQHNVYFEKITFNGCSMFSVFNPGKINDLIDINFCIVSLYSKGYDPLILKFRITEVESLKEENNVFYKIGAIFEDVKDKIKDIEYIITLQDMIKNAYSSIMI
ncbi:MAG TPA: hypothetical protein PKW55_01520 [Spirochaetota bacterium]|nr:hypothetical protein [Spirochaetota bacterium]HOM38896.1 hypothetical protein [Spirochaetota bacterium]HPQ49125.1 hypothetical protein [Spirochaetota bacterium]